MNVGSAFASYSNSDGRRTSPITAALASPFCQAGSTAKDLMLRFLLNVLWFVLGGVVMGLGWWLAGLVAAITIVGLPWARACFVIGNYSFWPFGNEAVSRRELTGRMDFGTGPLGLIGNVIWFLVAGWWLAIGHLTSALACFITIIGIPFGIQHIKLALIALAPIGLRVVPSGQR